MFLKWWSCLDLDLHNTDGVLERCHSYKDKIAKEFLQITACFAYPVLMAADILLYQANLVPVGKRSKAAYRGDSRYRNEIQSYFGETFVVPEGEISDAVAVIPGIDGQKMSKSSITPSKSFGRKDVEEEGHEHHDGLQRPLISQKIPKLATSSRSTAILLLRTGWPKCWRFTGREERPTALLRRTGRDLVGFFW